MVLVSALSLPVGTSCCPSLGFGFLSVRRARSETGFGGVSQVPSTQAERQQRGGLGRGRFPCPSPSPRSGERVPLLPGARRRPGGQSKARGEDARARSGASPPSAARPQLARGSPRPHPPLERKDRRSSFSPSPALASAAKRSCFDL